MNENLRPHCTNCGYITARCLCAHLCPIDNQTHLIILQHPSETKHALNTVRLMKKSYKRITVFIGEDFSTHNELNELIEITKSIALIYPNENAIPLEETTTHQKITHLIFIDGTWRKAHKIFVLSKNLQALASFKLLNYEKSQYRIRSSKFKEGLSTLEASTAALNVLERNLDTKTLTSAFNQMINFQIDKMGVTTFKKNYVK